jgi:hypothetical protein
MKKTIVFGILRALLASAGGWITSSGLMDDSQSKEVIGAIMVLVTAIWSVVEKYKAKGNNSDDTDVPVKTFGVIVLLLLLGLSQSGCASMLAVSSHDSKVEAAQALRMTPGADGKSAYVGLDLLQATGYIAAWKAAPGTMTAATVVDLLTGIGAYYGIKGATGGDDNSKQTTVTVNGDNNNTVVGGQDASGSHNQTQNPPAE